MPVGTAGDELRFLDPRIIARIGSMELKARTVVEGFLSGLHRSPFKGFSVEFAEYRQYLPGDDLATIDWKVYARSDRYYVRKFEEELLDDPDPDVETPVVLAFLFAHQRVRHGEIEDFLVSVDVIEALTGLDFFVGLDEDVEWMLEDRDTFENWVGFW